MKYKQSSVSGQNYQEWPCPLFLWLLFRKTNNSSHLVYLKVKEKNTTTRNTPKYLLQSLIHLFVINLPLFYLRLLKPCKNYFRDCHLSLVWILFYYLCNLLCTLLYLSLLKVNAVVNTHLNCFLITFYISWSTIRTFCFIFIISLSMWYYFWVYRSF